MALQEDGLAPPLHCRFINGFVYGYVPGIPLKSAQLSSEKLFPLIARKISLWHHVDCVPGDPVPRLFKTLRKWFKNIPKEYTNPEVESKFHSSIDLAYLQSELAALECHVKSLNCPVTFCHNDLLAPNIIYNPEKSDVTFIDYEYGSFNYRSFDIANHFCEYGGFECDYSLYPDENFQREWIKSYLMASDEDFSDESISIILKEVEIFTLAALFYWGLWALVQAEISDIHFDYMEYAILRFNEFKRRRSLLNY